MRIFWALFYKFFLSGVSFVTSIITARYLGPTGRGYLTNTQNYFSYYSPVIGTFSEYIPYGINKQKRDPQAVFSTSLQYYAVLAGTLFALALLGTKWLWGGFWGIDPLATRGAWIVGIMAPFAMFHVYVTRLMWGMNELEWLNRLNTVQAVVFLLLMLLVVFGFRPIEASQTIYVIGAWFGSYVLTSMFSLYVVRRKTNFRITLRGDKTIRRETMNFGLNLVGANLLWILNARIDMTLVFWLLGPTNMGVYSTAIITAELLNVLSSSILQVVLTRMSTLEEKDSTQLTARIFRHTAVVVILSVIGMYTIMTWVMQLAYGAKFMAATPIFHVVIPGIALYGLTTVLTTFFNNQLGRPRVTTMLQFVSILTNVVVSVLLIPHLGMMGSAWAKTLAYMTMFLVTVYSFGRLTGYPVRKLFYLQPDEVAQYRSLLRKIRAKVQRKTAAE
ncbi:oligosaccharide flippase family protein [Tumebacillus sp. ITR2]|uniref:Oligosaccharide flippase family protein n=1 Tax=Tumebacillus amylolyticus TaxID=2801339 RepID=A0ABS1J8T1_9BACL|nr:oligosaccharide flippase family protein [Tumebacillus amylolyticus]MBL0386687.1 oligosaccharide flippase family protein [Tumebacillus amylolyticus]